MTSLSPEARLVRAALEAQGLETPLVANELNGQQKKEKIEGHMRAILETLGLDLTDDSLAKTPLSLSHDPALKGVPRDFEVPIDEVRLCAGAGFVYALAGPIMTMPGLGSLPAYRHIDIDDEGEIIGLS